MRQAHASFLETPQRALGWSCSLIATIRYHIRSYSCSACYCWLCVRLRCVVWVTGIVQIKGEHVEPPSATVFLCLRATIINYFTTCCLGLDCLPLWCNRLVDAMGLWSFMYIHALRSTILMSAYHIDSRVGVGVSCTRAFCLFRARIF